MATLPYYGVKGSGAGPASTNVIKQICLNTMTGGDGATFGWHLQYGVRKETTEGDPGQPSLCLDNEAKWRFKLLLNAGTYTITIKVKQPVNLTPYPSLFITKNASIGVNNDIEAFSPGGTDWVRIQTSVTTTAKGILSIQLRNNVKDLSLCPCYFDALDVLS